MTPSPLLSYLTGVRSTPALRSQKINLNIPHFCSELIHVLPHLEYHIRCKGNPGQHCFPRARQQNGPAEPVNIELNWLMCYFQVRTSLGQGTKICADLDPAPPLQFSYQQTRGMKAHLMTRGEIIALHWPSVCHPTAYASHKGTSRTSHDQHCDKVI